MACYWPNYTRHSVRRWQWEYHALYSDAIGIEITHITYNIQHTTYTHNPLVVISVIIINDHPPCVHSRRTYERIFDRCRHFGHHYEHTNVRSLIQVRHAFSLRLTFVHVGLFSNSLFNLLRNLQSLYKNTISSINGRFQFMFDSRTVLIYRGIYEV